MKMNTDEILKKAKEMGADESSSLRVLDIINSLDSLKERERLLISGIVVSIAEGDKNITAGILAETFTRVFSEQRALRKDIGKLLRLYGE